VEDWLKVAIGAAIGGVLALIAAVATGWFSFASKDEELRVHLVEIAIGILRADLAKEDVLQQELGQWTPSTSTLACGLSQMKSERRFCTSL
jgi:hypothetical protein